MRPAIPIALAAMGLALAATSCSRKPEEAAKPEVYLPKADDGPVGGKKLSVPESVRNNLGIKFVTVERRPVRNTVRVPGEFELRPEAKRDYSVTQSGRVTLLVKQFDRVKTGQPLFRLDAPEWRQLQHSLGEAQGAIAQQKSTSVVAEKALEQARVELAFLEQRLRNLKDVNVRRVELENQARSLKQAVLVKETEVAAARAGYDNAVRHYGVMLDAAASVTGLSSDELRREIPSGSGGTAPHWQRLASITVGAEADGIVEVVGVTQGGWAETSTVVLGTVDPGQIRFRAEAPQTQIARLRDGQDVAIVSPQGGNIDSKKRITGKIQLGYIGDAAQRTIPIYVSPETPPTWARPGVTAYVEVYVGGSAAPCLAIPKSCIVRSGITDLIFRRLPEEPDRVLSIEVELGADDGRWVEVKKGLNKGDQVVKEGAYELKLANAQAKSSPKPKRKASDGPVDTRKLRAPESVRNNLGIKFVTVKRRPVRNTVRVPGNFELRPEAKRDYSVTQSGRVTLLVKQFDRVKAGQPLFRLDAPEWRQLQHDLGEAQGAITLQKSTSAVAEKALEQARVELDLLEQRLRNLKDVNVRRVELENQATSLKQAVLVKESEVAAARAGYDNAVRHYGVMLDAAASVTGLGLDELRREIPSGSGGMVPQWQRLASITVSAEADGIVEVVGVTQGGWAETGRAVLDTVNPGQIRFRAEAPQTQIARFRDGQDVAIVPPQGGSIDIEEAITGKLQLGYIGDAAQRTIPIYVDPESSPVWARPGVTAYVEVYVDGNASPCLAIPKSCVVRSGITDLIFRRLPKEPDRVMSIEVELGADDGRWIEVRSGLRKGDQVVKEGAYELKLANAQAKRKAGHICADGTWHEGEH